MGNNLERFAFASMKLASFSRADSGFLDVIGFVSSIVMKKIDENVLLEVLINQGEAGSFGKTNIFEKI